MSPYATPTDLIPSAYCVLGTMLRPFSLGRHLLLTKINSPFADAPEAVSPDTDLALAVFICAAPYAQTYESLIRGELESDFSTWLKRIKPRWWQRSRFDPQAESAKFSAYLAEGYSRPPVWRHDSPSTIEITAPDACLLKCRLVAAGFSEADILENYLPAVWYDYYTACELSQAETIENPRQWRTVFYTEQHHRRMHPVAVTK
jgi:hypothetical protein